MHRTKFTRCCHAIMLCAIISALLLAHGVVASRVLAPWSHLYARADAPPLPRLFDADARLFGADQHEIVFWRDAAGWCLFCEMVWLVLEVMAVPYQVRTVPLRRYMLDGEAKDPEYVAMVGPDGVVPGMQFSCGGANGSFTTAIQSVERIFEELEQRYPSRFPAGDAAIRARACQDELSVFERLRKSRHNSNPPSISSSRPTSMTVRSGSSISNAAIADERFGYMLTVYPCCTKASR